MHPKLSEKAKASLEDLGIEIRLNGRVTLSLGCMFFSTRSLASTRMTRAVLVSMLR